MPRESAAKRLAIALELDDVLWTSQSTRTAKDIRKRWLTVPAADRKHYLIKARRLLRCVKRLESDNG